MKKKRYTEKEIVRILDEVESGKSVAEICRQYQVSEGTTYRQKMRSRHLLYQKYSD